MAKYKLGEPGLILGRGNLKIGQEKNVIVLTVPKFNGKYKFNGTINFSGQPQPEIP